MIKSESDDAQSCGCQHPNHKDFQDEAYKIPFQQCINGIQNFEDPDFIGSGNKQENAFLDHRFFCKKKNVIKEIENRAQRTHPKPGNGCESNR